MSSLALHGFHEHLGATFDVIRQQEVVLHFGNPTVEYGLLRQTAALLDLSFRGRISVLGRDRERLLNGQITNNLKSLSPGQGCYAALLTPKGRLVADLFAHRLPEEFLIDLEPGLQTEVLSRLEKHLVSDDAELLPVHTHYGLLSIQGPLSQDALKTIFLDQPLPTMALTHMVIAHHELGILRVVNHRRAASDGFDLFVPSEKLHAAAGRLLEAVHSVRGGPAGWQASEILRIEAGIPRFGVDMDHTNLPQEAGIEPNAVSFNKGCYVGQEIMARMKRRGLVARSLRVLRLAQDLPSLPKVGTPLFLDGREIGQVRSAAFSPGLQKNLALGYLRREALQSQNTALYWLAPDGPSPVSVVEPRGVCEPG